MQDAPADSYSLQEAAALLSVSVNTLRKRIRAGQVRADRVERPQGYVWRVYLEGRHPPAQPASYPPGQEAPSRLQQPPTAMMQAEAMAAYTRSLLEPLVTLVAKQESTIREQAETIGELRERLSTQEARIATLGASGVKPASNLSTAPSLLWRRSWASYGVVGLVLVLIVAVDVLLVWSR